MVVLSAKERGIYFKLLEKYTSLGVVSLFLKELSLPHSAGSWDDMISKRLQPAILEGKISRVQLLRLLSDAEEFGHQNIFLFRCSKNAALELVNENTVQKQLGLLGRKDLLDNPPIIPGTEELSLAHVRFEHGPKGRRSLVVKAVEERTYWAKVSEIQTATKKTKEYDLRSDRAVDVARLYDDGLLEIRIQSYEQAADYDTALADFWSHVNHLLPRTRFEAQSLHKFKDYLIKQREQLGEKISYAPLLARSGTGFTMALGVPSAEKSLFKDKGAAEGFAAFAKHDASVESGNFIWKKQAIGKPSRDIHIRIAGKVNQFSVVVSCDRADYEQVFQDIRENHE